MTGQRLLYGREGDLLQALKVNHSRTSTLKLPFMRGMKTMLPTLGTH